MSDYDPRRLARDALARVHNDWTEQERGDAWEPAAPNGTAKRRVIVPGQSRPEPEGDRRGYAGTAAPDYRCELIDSAAFAAGDFRPQWLVKRLLVRGQPGVIGGPRKCLKTSYGVDLAVSLAAGIPFLGEFTVYQPARVALLSGESGEWTLQETARRVCAARGVDLAGLGDRLSWGFRLPQLGMLDQLSAVKDVLALREIEVLIFDPLYLALLAGRSGLDAANLFDIGPLLLNVGRTCLDVGCTPLLVHHTKKLTARNLEPLELDDLAYAGIAEFARQWLLLGRAEEYEPGSGKHVLWLSAGGSCGQSGLWQVTVDEGQLQEDFTGRTWQVAVAAAVKARADKAAESAEAKRRTQECEQEADAKQVLHAHSVMDPENIGVSFTRLRDTVGLSGPRYGKAVTWLLDNRKLFQSDGTATAGHGAQRKAKVLRRRREPED